MSPERVAMFIDFENLVYGVENNESAEQSLEYDVDIQRIVRFVRDEGRLVLARAYADWRNPGVRQHQRDLYVQGIETVNVFGRRHGAEVKNAVDVALAVDAVRSLYERQFDTFVLISGDRDFLPLLRVVREHGHRIIGVSVRSRPRATSPTSVIDSCITAISGAPGGRKSANGRSRAKARFGTSRYSRSICVNCSPRRSVVAASWAPRSSR